MTLPPPAPIAATPQQQQQQQVLDHYHPSPAMEAIQSVDKMLTSIEGASFEEIMKERNRIRKEREEYNIAELRVQIVRLEDALAAETKRRVDATTKLDDQAREQIYEMEQRLRKQLEEDNAKLESRLSQLSDRLQALEEQWTQDSTRQMELIDHKAQEFLKTMEHVQQEQDTERKARLRREGALLQQVEHHSKEFEDRWTAERQDRLQQIGKFEKALLEKETKRQQEQARFQTRVEEELELLKAELELEVQERQAQDEEIVAALNRYTQQLQQSLSILSSD